MNIKNKAKKYKVLITWTSIIDKISKYKDILKKK